MANGTYQRIRALKVKENDGGVAAAKKAPLGLKQINLTSGFVPLITGSSHWEKLVGASGAVEKPTSIVGSNVSPVGVISVKIISSVPSILPLASSNTYSKSDGKLSTRKTVSSSIIPLPELVTVIV